MCFNMLYVLNVIFNLTLPKLALFVLSKAVGIAYS